MVVDAGLKDLKKNPGWKDGKKAAPLFRKLRKRKVTRIMVGSGKVLKSVDKKTDEGEMKEKMIEPLPRDRCSCMKCQADDKDFDTDYSCDCDTYV